MNTYNRSPRHRSTIGVAVAILIALIFSGGVALAASGSSLPPCAINDTSSNNLPGTPVTVSLLNNDPCSLDPSTVQIIDPGSVQPMKEIVIPRVGTWTVEAENGDITFTPEEGFTDEVISALYTVQDHSGRETGAMVNITYRLTSQKLWSIINKSFGKRPGSGGDPSNWVGFIKSTCGLPSFERDKCFDGYDIHVDGDVVRVGLVERSYFGEGEKDAPKRVAVGLAYFLKLEEVKSIKQVIVTDSSGIIVANSGVESLG